MKILKSFSISSIAIAAFSSPSIAATLPSDAGTIFGDFFYRSENENPSLPSAGLGVANDPGQTGTWNMSGGDNIALTAPFPSANDPFLGIGSGAGSNGQLNMSGAGTSITMQGDQSGAVIQIGKREGVGNVVVQDGARIIVTDPTGVPGNSASIQLGMSGGDGTLTVSDADISISGGEGAYAFVGALDGGSSLPGGNGTVVLNNGATMSVTALDKPTVQVGTEGASVVLGQDDGIEGYFTVTNGSQLTVVGERQRAGISVGREEDTIGVFNVSNGGTVDITGNSLGRAAPTDDTAFIEVGAKEGAVGEINISGAGSEVSLSGGDAFVLLGWQGGYGEMNIADGGKLMSTAAIGELRIGEDTPSSASGGQGLLTVSGAGSLVDWGSKITLGNQSGLNSSEGTLIVKDSAEVIAGSGLEVYEGGSVKGDGGTVTGNVTLKGGTLAPGLSPGTLTIDGDLFIEGGLLELEIASALSYDVLNIFGSISASSMFDISLSFIDGYTPILGDTFDLFGSSNLDDSFSLFSNVSVMGLDRKLSADFDFASGASVRITENISAVPLPASFPLLAAGLIGLGWVGKRRKA